MDAPEKLNRQYCICRQMVAKTNENKRTRIFFKSHLALVAEQQHDISLVYFYSAKVDEHCRIIHISDLKQRQGHWVREDSYTDAVSFRINLISPCIRH